MWKGILKVTILLPIIFLFAGWRVEVIASDEIEETLSHEIGSFAESKLKDHLSRENMAYLYFLVAVYKHDSFAGENAEKIYRELNTPEALAFLGSIEILKARDLGNVGIFKGLVNIFKRWRYIKSGTEKLDRAVGENPDNLDIRIVRSITYLELPVSFGKFGDGLRDMKVILEWLKEGKVKVQEEEEFFRDKSSLYYYAGRYFLGNGQPDNAKEMFLKSAESSAHSPFSLAAKKRLLKK